MPRPRISFWISRSSRCAARSLVPDSAARRRGRLRGERRHLPLRARRRGRRASAIRSSAAAISSRWARTAATVSPYLRLSLAMASSRASICSSRSGSATARSRRTRTPGHHVLDLGEGGLEAGDRSRRPGSKRARPAQERAGAPEPGRRRLIVLVQQAHRLLERRRRSARRAAAACARREARPPRRPGAGRRRSRRAGSGRAPPAARARASPPAAPSSAPRASSQRRTSAPTALALALALGEAVEQIELAGRLHQALVLVLAVELDEQLAEALEEPHRRGAVVDEDPVPARAPELALDARAGRRSGGCPASSSSAATGPDASTSKTASTTRRLLARADQIGLGAGADDEQEGVDHDGLAGAGLAGEHVEAGARAAPRRPR